MEIHKLREKLQQLKARDSAYRCGASRVHHYEVRPPIEQARLLDFEGRYQIRLPEDYRSFLLQIGNGGAGPGCDGLFGIGYKSFLQNFLVKEDVLARPFPFMAAWCPRCSMMPLEDILKDAATDNPRQGSICLGSYGCSVLIHLVVTGKARGTIWVDDFGSDNGIWPNGEWCRCCFEDEEEYASAKPNQRRYTFFEWYDEWLTQGLLKMAANDDRS